MNEELKPAKRWRVVLLVLAVGIAMLVAGGVAVYAITTNREASVSNKETIERLKQETRERRDVGCKGAERQHAQEIRDVERSYEIYADPPPSFKKLLQEPFAIQGLQEDVRDARNDEDRFGVFVSPFCDDPGIGEKEPDPVMPKQPPEVRRLLRMAAKKSP